MHIRYFAKKFLQLRKVFVKVREQFAKVRLHVTLQQILNSLHE